MRFRDAAARFGLTAVARPARPIDSAAHPQPGDHHDTPHHLPCNSGLAYLSWRSGRDWAIYPLLGWGLGLTLHGLAVWLRLGGGGLHERWLAQERERLQHPRGPKA